MNSIIPQLMSCLEDLQDKRSKAQMATIIRRQTEIEMTALGLAQPKYNVRQDELDRAYQNKLEGVKMYKNRTGRGLMDSKHAIEDAMEGRVAVTH